MALKKVLLRVIGEALIFCLLLTIVFYFLFVSTWFDQERQDQYVFQVHSQIGHKLADYYFKNKKFPNSLSEVGMLDNIWLSPWKRFYITYKTVYNNQDFRLITKVNRPFVSYCQANWLEMNYAIKNNTEFTGFGCMGGLVFEESYAGDRNDLPIYRKPTPEFPEIFVDKDSWPEI